MSNADFHALLVSMETALEDADRMLQAGRELAQAVEAGRALPADFTKSCLADCHRCEAGFLALARRIAVLKAQMRVH
jgi:hypothetical protein